MPLWLTTIHPLLKHTTGAQEMFTEYLNPPSGRPLSVYTLSAPSELPPPRGVACLHHVFPLFPSSRDSCSPQWPGPPTAHPGADKDEVLALCPVLLFLKHDAQLVLDPLGLNELAD